MVHLMRDTKKKMVEDWNQKYRVGQKVTVKKDAGNTVETTTTSNAVLLGGHTPVIHVEGISGCYALDRVTPIVTVPISNDDTVSFTDDDSTVMHCNFVNGKLSLIAGGQQ